MTTTLITGANVGMGYETARALGRLGHRLILCARTDEKAESAKARLQKSLPDLEAHAFGMELASLASVRRAAARIRDAVPEIDCLVLNAGVMAPPYQRTEDGFELQFQVNYLSHFHLFRLLAEPLLASGGKRVVSISSMSSEYGRNDTLDDFTASACCEEHDYHPMTSYRESKLAQVLFTRELQYRYGHRGLKSYAVHPGLVNTNLFYRSAGPVLKALMQPLAWAGYAVGRVQPPAKGAATAVYLASADVEPGGVYWSNRKQRPHNPIADDAELCAALWDWSARVLDDAPAASETRAVG